MAYISSNNNRWYCQLENAFGQVGTITAQNRIPAVKMSIRQTMDLPARKDKTGSRTFTGGVVTGRRSTEFDLKTYMNAWDRVTPAPTYGPLFQASLGGSPTRYAGGVAGSASSANAVTFSAPHGLVVGQAITFGSEIRFVTNLIDASSVVVNAPFTSAIAQGSVIGTTVTYSPASDLPSFTVFDYWSPSTAVHRLLCGGAVNTMTIELNSDYQEFQFQGVGQDVVDTSSFEAGSGQLTAFPPEPIVDSTPITVIPGSLGQAWIGAIPNRTYTLTGAKLVLKNDIETRVSEFGTVLPQAVVPGVRTVLVDLDLYSQDDANTTALYQAARQRSPISIALQVGQAPGQLFGIYLKSVIPEVPEFDDSERRLQWSFSSSQAQGQSDDELFVAFG